MKVDAYNGINLYLSELSETRMKTIEDIYNYNVQNCGTEGADPSDHPAFPSGQVSKRRYSSLHWAHYIDRTTSSKLSKPKARKARLTLTLETISKPNVVEKELTRH